MPEFYFVFLWTQCVSGYLGGQLPRRIGMGTRTGRPQRMRGMRADVGITCQWDVIRGECADIQPWPPSLQSIHHIPAGRLPPSPYPTLCSAAHDGVEDAILFPNFATSYER
ncbi:hypothetical protein ARMGADRAFT_361919 [Armillaria gallica]|uniref:Uncharacterized protein n=1 Tax=Armillaria gallica TaxID=47427 RepID=A0A2H3DM91_ARMGA|nr:hypothetical protein ARMGADRAFT_361919 [Armillaria gallica]